MTSSPPRFGYVLPVFACAAAVAALDYLQKESSIEAVAIDLLEPPQPAEIPIEQVAKIGEKTALAIALSDPGDNLDLTRNTPVWAMVESIERGREDTGERIILKGGEGVGRQIDNLDRPAIYSYARRLFLENLLPRLKPDEKVAVTIILPEGRRLARRTSNHAFGVVEGLSLLGTTGISQPLSTPAQLAAYREELAVKARKVDCLAFCLGENGLDLAQKLGIAPENSIKTANWLGPLLVDAGMQGVSKILLFGYHGKLLKLAGGIFHTHHHLADGRMEILTAHCARAGMPNALLQEIFASDTAEAALQLLREFDRKYQSDWTKRVYGAIAATIDSRSGNYIFEHSERKVLVGSFLFERNRTPIVLSGNGRELFDRLCYNNSNI